MPAKDIIDLIIECPIGTLEVTTNTLATVGYRHQGDLGIPTREAYEIVAESDASRQPHHHPYLCESDSPELLKQLAFRDYLIAQPERADWLAQQKIEADRTADSRSGYIANKADAYNTITEESLRWTSDKH